ncbi:hypothetical protein NIES4075_56210 [Tolypothrix sp. NIES-4075]|uniref:hypothetical protein n=1 Tax=Tolypothrix sp. NIES-4075 TaxID=2005459 RepID=UPI000B6CC09B|nr:hypothetical protein [Tolypothrix sp. NIES-4075]GAX44602.1 hypothetical protein NIES4075_56210 [Tolypothrix sp. NIES-4075]
MEGQGDKERGGQGDKEELFMPYALCPMPYALRTAGADSVRDLPSPSQSRRRCANSDAPRSVKCARRALRVTLLRRRSLPQSGRLRERASPLRIERQSAQRGEPAHAAGSGTGNRAALTHRNAQPNLCPMPNAQCPIMSISTYSLTDASCGSS